MMDVHGTVTAQCSPNPMAAYYNSSFPGIFNISTWWYMYLVCRNGALAMYLCIHSIHISRGTSSSAVDLLFWWDEKNCKAGDCLGFPTEMTIVSQLPTDPSTPIPQVDTSPWKMNPPRWDPSVCAEASNCATGARLRFCPEAHPKAKLEKPSQHKKLEKINMEKNGLKNKHINLSRQ